MTLPSVILLKGKTPDLSISEVDHLLSIKQRSPNYGMNRKKESIPLYCKVVKQALKRGFGTGYILSGVFDLHLPSGDLVARWQIDQTTPNTSWLHIQKCIRRMRSAAALSGWMRWERAMGDQHAR